MPGGADVLGVPWIDVFGPPITNEPPPVPDTTTTTTTDAPDIFIPDHSHDHDHSSGPSAPSVPTASGSGMPASRRNYHVYYQPKYETKPMLQRRYRRDIYRNVEGVIDK